MKFYCTEFQTIFGLLFFSEKFCITGMGQRGAGRIGRLVGIGSKILGQRERTGLLYIFSILVMCMASERSMLCIGTDCETNQSYSEDCRGPSVGVICCFGFPLYLSPFTMYCELEWGGLRDKN